MASAELIPSSESTQVLSQPPTSALPDKQPEQTKETPPPIPGPKAAAFLQLHRMALDATLKSISYDHFAACFPSIAERAPENLRGFYSAVVERLEERVKIGFELIVRERNVVENLNELQELLADAQRRKDRGVEGEQPPVPPHILPPSTILTTHLLPTLTTHQSQLNARIQTTQSQNIALFTSIQQQRQEIEALTQALEARVHDLEAAVGGLGDESLKEGGLRQLVKDVGNEVEMSGT